MHDWWLLNYFFKESIVAMITNNYLLNYKFEKTSENVSLEHSKIV
jgi:hypothetical protein